MSVQTRAPYILDAETVAKVCNVSLSSLYNYAKKGNLPFKAEKFGNLWRFRRTEVEAWLGCTIEEALAVEVDTDTEAVSA